MGEDQSQSREVNEDVRGTGRLTITEAATLLKVHPNTVRSRVKAGLYDAEKVFTENGFTWMGDRDSLINPPLPEASQQRSSQAVNSEVTTPMELVQDLLKPFVEDLGRVREELGVERFRREQAERERDELAARLQALTETATEEPSGAGVPPEAKAGETPSSRPERSWWRRWFGFE